MSSSLGLLLLAVSLWVGVSVVVVAFCRIAARADEQIRAEDDAVAMAGPMGWLLSEAFPGEYVTDRAQEDLHVAPQRPVRDVQIIHRTHLA